MLLEATGYWAMLRDSPGRKHRRTIGEPARAGPPSWWLPYSPRTAGSCSTEHERPEGGWCGRPGEVDDAAQKQGPGVRPRLPACLGAGCVPPGLRRRRRGTPPCLRGDHARDAACDHLVCRVSARSNHSLAISRRHPRTAPLSRMACRHGARFGLVCPDA